MALSICVAQLDYVVGDMAVNARRIIDAAGRAHAQGARLLLTPELALCGGPLVQDLLCRPGFVTACDDALQTVARETAALAGMMLVVGHPVEPENVDLPAADGLRCNGASVIRDGRVVARHAKSRLSPDLLGDERRCLVAGTGMGVIEVDDVRIALLIGAEMADDAVVQDARAAGAQLLLSLGAAPFHLGSGAEREARWGERARTCGLPLVGAQAVGGQDELVFEGRSLAIDAAGRLAGRGASFAEDLFFVRAAHAAGGVELAADIAPAHDRDRELWGALVLALRDYVRKSGMQDAALGLSGGMDSALVLALAVDALGAEHVRVLLMPSPYTAAMSLEDGHEMARRLGVRCDVVAIGPVFESYRASLAPLFAGRPEDTTEENLQARIRGALLMALSNKFGHLILDTGNKSETATGYCTLYGDMCGGFAPIKDVLKTTVYQLARWRNVHDPFKTGLNPIPERIIARPPSAELRPGQTDQDSLPPYEVLDAIIERYVEEDASVADLVRQGFEPAVVERVVNLIRISEYKRRQSAIGPRVTRRGFGAEWRYPVVNRFVA